MSIAPPLGNQGFRNVFRVEIEGFGEMLSRLGSMGFIARLAARDALRDKADEIKAKTVPLIPDDPESRGGHLYKAVRIYVPRTASLRDEKKPIYAGVVVGGKRLEKRIGKRSSIAWPIIQHEDLTLKHTKGQAKFLEIPGRAVAATIPEAISAKLDEYMEKFKDVLSVGVSVSLPSGPKPTGEFPIRPS